MVATIEMPIAKLKHLVYLYRTSRSLGREIYLAVEDYIFQQNLDKRRATTSADQ
jgi:hypothetical protein